MIDPEYKNLVDCFVDDLINFDDFGSKTEVVEACSGSNDSPLRYFINEFWTSAQRAGHPLHEISYRACFKPQLPEFFIRRLTNPSDSVYDPFMGRGTTPIQSALLDRKALGNDVNPMSILMTRPRLNTPKINDVEARLAELDWDAGEITEHDQRFNVFYHPSTLRQIIALRDWLHEREKSCQIDLVDDWIRLVAMSRLTGHSSGFFSVYTLPPNQSVSIDSQRRINERRRQFPSSRDVGALIIRKSRSLLRQGGISAEGTELSSCDARDTAHIQRGTVDLVVTSPPFLDIVNYLVDNHVRAWFTGIDIDAQSISMPSNADDWQRFTSEVLSELCRVVKPGGIICYEVGEVRKATIKLENVVHAAARAAELPVEMLGVLVNQQEFSKTSNVWGITNNHRGTNTNRVVMMRVLD